MTIQPAELQTPGLNPRDRFRLVAQLHGPLTTLGRLGIRHVGLTANEARQLLDEHAPRQAGGQ